MEIYNTPKREKEQFKPIDPNNVRIYICGPTVYDLAHIGNARPVVVFDTLYRFLKTLYPNVTYVRNITDVDDKINQRAKENDESIQNLTERTFKAFSDDMQNLNALEPTIQPRVTDHIPHIIEMIEKLIKNGHAYVKENHVFFSVESFKNYGNLSKRNQTEQNLISRLEDHHEKEKIEDFVLWKPSEDDLPGWNSPWGYGRPGWHIECSAMATHYLGQNFDIHGGGSDLIFPHHENEIAQSTCAHQGSHYAQYWMHNGHVMVDGKKMSKSLGNFITVRDLLDQGWEGEIIRYVLLMTHYRSELNWTTQKLEQAKTMLDQLYMSLDLESGVDAVQMPLPIEVQEALENDLNTPLALAIIDDLMTDLNKAKDPHKISEAKGRLLASANVMGLLLQKPEDWFKRKNKDIQNLVDERQEAKDNKDYDLADRLRSKLNDLGVIVQDTKSGPKWRFK